MKTIDISELSNITGGQASPMTAAQYGNCMNNASQSFAKTNGSIMQGIQAGKLSPDEFVKQGTASATTLQGAAADCAKQFPLQ
jgi:bacteriocin-like protein